MKNLAFTSAIVLLVSVSNTFAQARFPLTENGLPTLSPLLEEVTPAVVNIAVQTKATTASNPFFEDPNLRRFFNFQQPGAARPQQSAGAGVIIDAEEGYVLSNHHVIADADKVMVTLQDKRQFKAKVIGSDEGTDIALLKIEGEELKSIAIGDSNTLKVKDKVKAIDGRCIN